MGHVELRDGCVVFVFPEHPDGDGQPLRVRWWEAAEADLILERCQEAERIAPEQMMPAEHVPVRRRL